MTRIPPLLRAALALRAETGLSRLFLPAQEGETQNTAMNDISKTARAVMLAAANGNLNVVDDPVYKQCVAAAFNTAVNHGKMGPEEWERGSPDDYEKRVW